MKKEHKNLLVWGGVAVVGGIVIYNMLKPKSTPAVATSTPVATTNFTGQNRFANQTGNMVPSVAGNMAPSVVCCVSIPACKVYPTGTAPMMYSCTDIKQAKATLINNGTPACMAPSVIQCAVNNCQPIAPSQLTCTGFVACDPSLGINWYNPFSWHGADGSRQGGKRYKNVDATVPRGSSWPVVPTAGNPTVPSGAYCKMRP